MDQKRLTKAGSSSLVFGKPEAMTSTNVRHSSSMAEAATSRSHVMAFSTSLEEYDQYDAEIENLAASSNASEELETGCCEEQSGAR